MALLDTLTEELLGPKSVAELVKTHDATEKQVREVVTASLPLFISGMYQNSSTEDGAASLAAALDVHAPNAEKSTAAMLKKADVEDGKKIVTHILGAQEKEVVKSLAGSTKMTQKKTTSMLAQLAPVVLALVGSYKQQELQAQQQQQQANSANLLGLLGGALLGNSYQQQTPQQQSGLNVANIAGALLGGGNNQTSASGALIGSLVGSLLSSNQQQQQPVQQPLVQQQPVQQQQQGGGLNLSGLLLGLLK